MTLDAKIRPLAERLIENYGKELLLVSRVEGTFDPETGAVTATDPAAVSIRGIVQAVDLHRVNGVNVLADDLVVLLAGTLETAPAVGDLLYLGSSTSDRRTQVVAVRPIYSGELVAAYEVICR